MNELISVHGFQFDPNSEKDNPDKFHEKMASFCGRPTTGFSWYSYPLSLSAFWKAYKKGYFLRPLSATYRAAFDDAKTEAARLAALVNAKSKPVDIIAHSLGTRVVLQALPYIRDEKIGRIVLLNGAEKSKNAVDLLPSVRWPVLNLAVKTDNILSGLGSWADAGMPSGCIGNHGLDGADHPFWKTVVLDDVVTKQRAASRYEWRIMGDNPNKIGDHWYSYESKSNNSDLVRYFLDGSDIDL